MADPGNRGRFVAGSCLDVEPERDTVSVVVQFGDNFQTIGKRGMVKLHGSLLVVQLRQGFRPSGNFNLCFDSTSLFECLRSDGQDCKVLGRVFVNIVKYRLNRESFDFLANFLQRDDPAQVVPVSRQ